VHLGGGGSRFLLLAEGGKQRLGCHGRTFRCVRVHNHHLDQRLHATRQPQTHVVHPGVSDRLGQQYATSVQFFAQNLPSLLGDVNIRDRTVQTSLLSNADSHDERTTLELADKPKCPLILEPLPVLLDLPQPFGTGKDIRCRRCGQAARQQVVSCVSRGDGFHLAHGRRTLNGLQEHDLHVR